MKKVSEKKPVKTFCQVEPIAGLYDKKAFEHILSNEILRAGRNNSCVSLSIIRIDGYNKISKACGKTKEAVILKTISETMKKNVRAYFPIARLSKDEFAIILPDTVKGRSISILRGIRKKISHSVFKDSRNNKIKITLSIGIANYPENALNKSKLIKRAKEALAIASKENGNRVISYVSTSKSSIKLAICFSEQGPFYSYVLLGMREIIEDAGNIDLRIYHIGHSPDDLKKQGSGIRKAISEKPDVLAISSKADVGPYVKLMNEEKISVFGFNILNLKMTPKGKIHNYIGYDYRKAGRMAGNYVTRILRGTGKIILLEGPPSAKDSIDCKNGFLEAIKNYNGIKIVDSAPAYWKRNTGKEVTDAMLNKHPDIDCILGLNDEMALGALASAREMNRLDKIFIIGVDGTKMALQSIKDGMLSATLSLNPIAMGSLLMKTILRSMVKEEKIPPRIESPILMIDPVNIDDHLQ